MEYSVKGSLLSKLFSFMTNYKLSVTLLSATQDLAWFFLLRCVVSVMSLTARLDLCLSQSKQWLLGGLLAFVLLAHETEGIKREMCENV